MTPVAKNNAERCATAYDTSVVKNVASCWTMFAPSHVAVFCHAASIGKFSAMCRCNVQLQSKGAVCRCSKKYECLGYILSVVKNVAKSDAKKCC